MVAIRAEVIERLTLYLNCGQNSWYESLNFSFRLIFSSVHVWNCFKIFKIWAEYRTIVPVNLPGDNYWAWNINSSFKNSLKNAKISIFFVFGMFRLLGFFREQFKEIWNLLYGYTGWVFFIGFRAEAILHLSLFFIGP
jgi:hypothetical protein